MNGLNKILSVDSFYDVNAGSIDVNDAAILFKEEEKEKIVSKLKGLGYVCTSVGKEQLPSPLHCAAILGDASLCEELLIAGCKADDTDVLPFPPFYYASQLGNLECAKILAHHTNLFTQFPYPEATSLPLWGFLNPSTVTYLVEKDLLPFNSSTLSMTLLGLAISTRHLPLVKALLGKGANLSDPVFCFGEEVPPYLLRSIPEELAAKVVSLDELKEDFRKQNAFSLALRLEENVFLQLLQLAPEQFLRSDPAKVLELAVHSPYSEALLAILSLNPMLANQIDSIGSYPLERVRVLKKLQNEDPKIKGITEAAYRRLKFCTSSCLKDLMFLGHAFSLKGKSFEGYYSHKPFYKALRNEMTTHLSKVHHFSDLNEALYNAIHLDLNAILAQYQRKVPVVVPTGWKGHATACLFFREYLVKIDTSGGGVGVVLYEMQNRDFPVVEGVITKLLNTKESVQQREGAKEYFTQEIDEILQLKQVSQFRYECRQKSGNCQFQSALYALRALLILDAIKAEVFTEEDFQKATEDTSDLFCLVRRNIERSKLYLLTPDYEKEIVPPVSKKELLDQVIIRMLDRNEWPILNELLQRVPEVKKWRHPENGHTLWYLAYEKRLYEVSMACREADADWDPEMGALIDKMKSTTDDKK